MRLGDHADSKGSWRWQVKNSVGQSATVGINQKLWELAEEADAATVCAASELPRDHWQAWPAAIFWKHAYQSVLTISCPRARLMDTFAGYFSELTL